MAVSVFRGVSVDQLAGFIRELGFPIAVAGFVLVRLNGKMDRLTDALLGLAALVKEWAQLQREQNARIAHLEDIETRKGSL